MCTPPGSYGHPRDRGRGRAACARHRGGPWGQWSVRSPDRARGDRAGRHARPVRATRDRAGRAGMADPRCGRPVPWSPSARTGRSPRTDARGVLATAREPLGAAAAGGGLSGIQALEGCTTHAALAAGEGHETGRIAPGLRADLTAFGLDPVAAPADELAQAPVRLTVTGGHVVHRGD
ncbi:amidohydrolase family protein [Streptomyces sp. NPDC058086]|uniref:amidohydrolase family protein n=1 Tax=Streptomyces sp. NPDC058086 TaxID=3346334 RepID=UPI0036ED7D15